MVTKAELEVYRLSARKTSPSPKLLEELGLLAASVGYRLEFSSMVSVMAPIGSPEKELKESNLARSTL